MCGLFCTGMLLTVFSSLIGYVFCFCVTQLSCILHLILIEKVEASVITVKLY